MARRKDKVAAALFAIFLGVFGIHRLYLGQIGWFIVYLLTGGIFGIGALIDFIRYLLMDEETFDRKYNSY